MKCALLAIALCVTGCAVTDTGNPPLTPIDRERMSALGTFGGQLTIEGAAGAVPEGDVVRITNLDSTADPVDAAVASDGSFSARFAAEVGDRVRIQAIAGDARTAPLDVVGDTLAPIVHPLACVTLGADDVRGAAEILVANGCAEPLDLSVSLRRPTGALTARLDAARILPLQSTVLRITPVDAAYEEIVFVGAGADRFAITAR